jgi:tRNA A37 threonylcarbamoyladenosine biosynthesis protein TsaE
LGVAEGEEGSAVNENELWDELQAELKELDLQDDQVDEGLLLVDWDQEIKSFMTEENTT